MFEHAKRGAGTIIKQCRTSSPHLTSSLVVHGVETTPKTSLVHGVETTPNRTLLWDGVCVSSLIACPRWSRAQHVISSFTAKCQTIVAIMSETELGNADTMAMMEEAANLILQAKNDEMKISQLVDSIELGDEDASILGQIQSWFSPRVAVSCRIIGPAKMIAKIASKAFGKPISFLNILMHECDATIAQWDGEGDPPPPLAFPNLYGNPLNQWYGRVEKARREQLEGFMAEEKQCLPAAGADGSLSTWKKYIRLGRSVYTRLRHALPAGTTQEAVHAKVHRMVWLRDE